MQPAYDNGLGNNYLGQFYFIAPWPMGSKSKALKHWEEALRLSPNSLRNAYHLAVYHYRDKKYEEALPRFQFVVDNPCQPGSETDISDFLKAEAARGIASIAERTRKSPKK